MNPDIEDILAHKYSEYQWSIKNNDYGTLEWSPENSIPKPSYEELIAHSEDGGVQTEIADEHAVDMRQSQIIDHWPITKQFEAITENAMGRPEKLNELNDFIMKTKEDFPKS
jgi:hypothetical protein